VIEGLSAEHLLADKGYDSDATIDALWDAVGILLDTVQPAECQNYFKSFGYVIT
jgi:hypothetical protein